MKQFILAGSLLVSSIGAAQDFEDKYLGADFIGYKGTQLNYKTSATSALNYTFYSDLKYCQSLYDGHVLYPEAKYDFNTSVDSMVGRTFTVLDIVDKGGRSIESDPRMEPPIFVLKDINSGQVIYFKYDVKYKHKFPFLTKGMVLDKERLCKSVSRSVDDFTDEVEIRTPLMSGSVRQPMSLSKTITNEKSAYYLSLRTTGPTVVVDGNEAIVLFTDGTKWKKAVKIDVEAGDDGFDYRAFIAMTKEDLDLFQHKQVEKFRLYIYDQSVDSLTSEKFMALVECVVAKT